MAALTVAPLASLRETAWSFTSKLPVTVLPEVLTRINVPAVVDPSFKVNSAV